MWLSHVLVHHFDHISNYRILAYIKLFLQNELRLLVKINVTVQSSYVHSSNHILSVTENVPVKPGGPGPPGPPGPPR